MLGCEGARTGQARAEGGAEQDVADLACALARCVQRRSQAAVHTKEPSDFMRSWLPALGRMWRASPVLHAALRHQAALLARLPYS